MVSLDRYLFSRENIPTLPFHHSLLRLRPGNEQYTLRERVSLIAESNFCQTVQKVRFERDKLITKNITPLLFHRHLLFTFGFKVPATFRYFSRIRHRLCYLGLVMFLGLVMLLGSVTWLRKKNCGWD